MRVLQGLGAAITVGILLSIFLVTWLHATWPVAIGASAALSVAIVAVVGTRSAEHDDAADDAWLAAAPDLPPSSDRRAMDAAQIQMPGPEKGRRTGDRAAAGTAAGAAARPGSPKPGATR